MTEPFRTAKIIALVVAQALSGFGVGQAQDSRPAGRAFNPNARYAIAWATYLGGPGRDWVNKAMALPDGSIVVGGYATGDGMPTTPGAVQPKYRPPESSGGARAGDVYLARLSASGQLLAATYLGGSDFEHATDLAVDRAGNVIVVGETSSQDFPVTPDGAQTTFGGQADWIAAKLTPDLKKIVWATFLGGPGTDRGPSLLVAADDGVILVGLGSPGFPQSDEDVNLGSRDPEDAGDVCVVKLQPDASRVISSSRFGGAGPDLVSGAATMADGSILVSGFTRSRDFPFPEKTMRIGPCGGESDAFVAQLRPDGQKLLGVTVFGGLAFDSPRAPFLGPDGSVIVAGDTRSSDFPTTPQAWQRSFGGIVDGFVASLTGPGGDFKFATLVGGPGDEGVASAKLGPDGAIWVLSRARDANETVTGDALRFFAGGESDGMLTALAPDGSKLEFRTYVGGEGKDSIGDFVFGPAGEIYLVGATTSTDLPTTAASPQPTHSGREDGFVMKLVPRPNGVESRPSPR